MEYNQLRIELGALATGMFYNAQEQRIKAFNRIRQVIFRKLEGLDLTEKQDKKDEKDYEKKYTDKQLIDLIKAQKGKLSEEEQEYVDKLMGLLEDSMKRESKHKSLMKNYIELEPIYKDWLKDVKGISTLNTANLLQYFGYSEKAKHCSSLWKYAGLHVVNGKAPKLSMYGEGKEVETGLDYNPKLRTLMYRIGDCFIKQRTEKYRDIYDSEKRLQLVNAGCSEELLDNLQKEQEEGNITSAQKNTKINKVIKEQDKGVVQSIGHADNRARRKMVKEFLKDYYNKCLVIRGVEPDETYSARFHKA